MITKHMEIAIFQHLHKLGVYLCFEVGMPYFSEHSQQWLLTGGRCDERVDLLQYDSKGVWRFYELKLTKKDFYSKHKHTFYGHYNYFVMPIGLYEKVEKDIPSHVGVFGVGSDNANKLYVVSLKKAKKQSLGIDEEALKFKFMQALAREVSKHIFSEGCVIERKEEQEVLNAANT